MRPLAGAGELFPRAWGGKRQPSLIFGAVTWPDSGERGWFLCGNWQQIVLRLSPLGVGTALKVFFFFFFFRCV